MAEPAKSVKMIDILKEACTEVDSYVSSIKGNNRGAKTMGRGAGGDISTLLDVQAERIIFKLFKKRGLRPTIIAEEAGIIYPKRDKVGIKSNQADEGFLIIDAIDGTTNVHRGIPFYCCSVAFAQDFKLSGITDAAIIDLVRSDLYWASKGRGAFVGKKRIHANSARNFGGMIGLNISSLEPSLFTKLVPLVFQAKHVRQLGAVALELCLVARGSLDAYIDFRGKVRPTDLAAGYLIAKEAGAEILSASGTKLDASLAMSENISFFAGSKKARQEYSANLFAQN